MATTTDLYNAIEENDFEAVKRIYADSDGLTQTDSWSAPLFQSAGLGHTEIVRYLLENCDLFVDDGDDTTWYSPLMTACENGYLEIAKLLLKHGADANRQYEKEYDSDESYSTCQEMGYPLTLAVDGGHTEIIRLLLEYGADTECEKYSYDGSFNSRETPLMLALRGNRVEIAEILITNGADCCAECLIDGEAHTPLSFCIARAELDRVQWLLDRGADPHCLAEVDEMGKVSAFMYAVYMGITSKKKVEERYEIVSLFTKSGIDLTGRFEGYNFETLPDLVLESGNEQYLKLFGLQNIKMKIEEYEQDEQQEHSLVPDFLELKIGSQVSPTFRVFLDGDTLVWQVFDPEDTLQDTKQLSVKDRDWERFWMLCDMAGVWYWHESFKGEIMPDGKNWSLHICYRGKEAHASGINAFPVDEDYPECDGYPPLFRKFLRAVNDLLHGLPFE